MFADVDWASPIWSIKSGDTVPRTADLLTFPAAQALATLGAAETVTLEPLHTFLSTREAANFMRIFRPTPFADARLRGRAPSSEMTLVH